MDAYPRDLEKDLALLETEGVDLVWMPDNNIMYPEGFQTWVRVDGVAQPLEGARRPGHFRGVTTVVAKLFNGVLPDKVYMALKSLLNLLDDIKTMLPDAAIREVLERSGYLEYLQKYSKSSSDYTAREENLDQLIYSSSQYSTLLDYLEDASLVKEDKAEDKDSETGVSLSTMHASKGLEFYTVFVVGDTCGV